MLKVSDILLRDVQVEWFEAVALVRETLDQVHAVPGMHLPELHNIVLQPSGQVVLTGGSEAADPIQRAGQMIQTLIGRSEPPVQLRLLVAQATAPLGRPYDSLRALDEALAFFERPGRANILQELYVRVMAAPPAMVEGEAPVEAQRRKKPADPAVAATRRNAAMVVGGAILVAALGAVAVSLLGNRSEAGQTQGSRLVEATRGVGTAVAGVVSSIGDRVGLNKQPQPQPPDQTAPVPEPAPPAKPTRAKRSPAGVPAGARLENVVLRAFDPVVPPAATKALAPIESLPTAPAEPDDTIYTADAKDVTAPVARRPQLPRDLPPGIPQAELSRIEVVVLEDGTVESVKLISGPRNVHHAMFLSAVKAWEFRPAMKQGVPVKYRKTVWLAR